MRDESRSQVTRALRPQTAPQKRPKASPTSPPIANNQKNPTPKWKIRTSARLTPCSSRCSKVVVIELVVVEIEVVVVVIIVKLEVVLERVRTRAGDDEVDGLRP